MLCDTKSKMPVLRDFQPEVLEDAAELSDVPSILIRQAIGDMWVVMKNPDVQFHGGVWCSVQGPSDMFPDRLPQCQICLAGAVMLRRLPTEMLDRMICWPGSFPANVPEKLAALDDLRTGNVRGFLNTVPGWTAPTKHFWGEFKFCPPLFSLPDGPVSKQVTETWRKDADAVADWLQKYDC